MRYRVGIDTGGTFTDLVAIGGGRTIALKVPSTPREPARAVLAALDALDAQLARLGVARSRAEFEVVHGTTVATNTLLEGKGARVLFVTNAGFEDLVEIGRQARPRLHDLFPRRPDPFVARGDRLGVEERTLADGTRLRRPTRRELVRLVERVRRRGGESLAIGLLHSFEHPDSELELERALAKLGLPISRSSDVAPLFREYERFSTTIANAALVPRCRDYLERLAQARARTKLFVLQSNGGWTSARLAARRPVALVLSGPAGGLAAAHARLAASGVRGAITLDMGGTSTDVGLLASDGSGPRRTDQVDLDGRPLQVDALDVHSIGAGGGSLLWIDDGGSLRVGPRSAGAEPGPACYGRGTLPCLTDAHVVLGRLPVRGPLGGAIELEPRRSFDAIAPLARRLRVSVTKLAAAALDVADAAMEQAAKKVSLERGHDPRELALFAFGGAGGLHACRLAARLAMREVVVPPLPGATSAWGMATSDARLSFSRGLVRTVDAASRRVITAKVRELESEARRALVHELGPGPVRVERSLALRYRGQSFELEVALHGRDFVADFETLHRTRYGFALEGAPVECVALHVAVVRPAPAPVRRPARAARSARLAGVGRAGAWPVVERDSLPVGAFVRGPCVVVEPTATTVVERGFVARVDATRSLRLIARARK
jgi:N-methylhydantoinase A